MGGRQVDAGDPVRSFWSQDLGAAHTDYPVIDYVYRGIVTSVRQPVREKRGGMGGA